MTIKMLLNTALSNAENVINKTLNLDPVSKKKLAKFSGKSFAIECESPSISIYITILEQGMSLSSIANNEVDAHISGSAQALLQLLIAQNKATAMRDNNIHLKGDITSIQELQSILFELNIDWEYQLSKFIGDIPTQALSESLDLLKDFIEKGGTSLRNDIDEFIHEEVNLVPTAYELEDFYSRIDSLKLRLDRSQAKLFNLVV